MKFLQTYNLKICTKFLIGTSLTIHKNQEIYQVKEFNFFKNSVKSKFEIFTDLEDDLVLEDQILPPNNSNQEEINSTEKIETLIVIENTETETPPPEPEVVPVQQTKKPEQEIITTEELIEILKDESKENQPCKEVSSEDHENEIKMSSTKNEKLREIDVLPPQPPKRSSETNKRLKKTFYNV